MGKRILVIGAGIVGASVAWHLARTGCEITIVDHGGGGGLATRHSFAWINASWGNPEPYFHFRRRSMQYWRQLQVDIPGVDVKWCGGLLWGLPPEELDAFAAEHRRWGYALRWVDRDEILRLEPNLVAPPERALHAPEEAMVEPVQATRAMLAGSEAAGAAFLAETPIASLLSQNGRVTGAVTVAGAALEADETVIAAGSETPRLLRTVGLDLKMTAPSGLIAHSTISEERLVNGLVMSPDFHVRQTAEGRLIVGADFAGGKPTGDGGDMASGLIGTIRAAVRGARKLDLAFHTIGHRPTPADGLPAIGRPAGMDGLYVTVMHSGITVAPAAGLLAAREITGGGRDPDLAPYALDRPGLA